MLGGDCFTKKETAKILGVSVRMVDKYIAQGLLKVNHMEKHRVMIKITEVYNLRQENKNRKRG